MCVFIFFELHKITHRPIMASTISLYAYTLILTVAVKTRSKL